MDSFDPKLLKKLVKECRKLGVASFKGYGMEFTVSPLPEKQSTTRVTKSTGSFVQGEIETDSLSQEDLLFWSTTTEETADRGQPQ